MGKLFIKMKCFNASKMHFNFSNFIERTRLAAVITTLTLKHIQICLQFMKLNKGHALILSNISMYEMVYHQTQPMIFLMEQRKILFVILLLALCLRRSYLALISLIAKLHPLSFQELIKRISPNLLKSHLNPILKSKRPLIKCGTLLGCFR